MRILQVHNKYMSGPGGEDAVVESERNLLLKNGHIVQQYLASNSEVKTDSIVELLTSGIQSIWSSEHYRLLQRQIEEFKPHVVHVHNTFAAMSPSIFWAIKRAKIPCVMTLHNFRLICATGILFRNGQLCEKCIGRYPLPALQYRCHYKGSVLLASLIAATQIIHRWFGTYIKCVDAFIVLSESFVEIMKRAGMPADKLHIKHNPVSDTFEQNSGRVTRQPDFVYVGQITEAKGIDLLLDAWSAFETKDGRLVIIGDGPDRVILQKRYKHRTDIVWLGYQAHGKVLEIVSRSTFLVMPSRWHEPLGLSAIEALMLSIPVIVPNHIAFASFVNVEETGFTYEGSSITSLSQVLKKATQLDALDWDRLSLNARRVYLENFTPTQNYKTLTAIYDHVIHNIRA